MAELPFFTVAVNITGLPAAILLEDTDSIVVTEGLFTARVIAVDVTGPSLEFPAQPAVMV